MKNNTLFEIISWIIFITAIMLFLNISWKIAVGAMLFGWVINYENRSELNIKNNVILHNLKLKEEQVNTLKEASRDYGYRIGELERDNKNLIRWIRGIKDYYKLELYWEWKDDPTCLPPEHPQVRDWKVKKIKGRKLK